MKDYAAMSDFDINCEVSKLTRDNANNPDSRYLVINDYCNNPADAWPILLENHIAVVPYQYTLPQAWPTSFGLSSNFTTEDSNPLRAGMIVFLKLRGSKND